MKRRLIPLLAVSVFLATSATETEAQARTAASTAMSEVAAADLEWNDIEVPGFAPGMQIAILHGDPSVADDAYTLRLEFPDGYRFPPHWHPRAEHLTVLEGTFVIATGEEFDESELVSHGPGDYMFFPAENRHFGGAEGRTVIQLHGMGPFEINVVEGQEMSGS